MRKEVLLAIVAGGVFGLIIAFGIWRLNSSFSQSDGISTEGSPTPKPTNGLTIAKPFENQVFSKSSATISGIAEKGSSILISAEEEDYLIEVAGNGEFEQEVDLVGGLNQIVISLISNGVVSSEQKLVAVYSSQFSTQASADEESEANEEETSTDDEILQKVQEKVQEISSIGYAYIGTVTDVSENTFQIRTSSGDIMQVGSDSDTDFVNTTGSENKTVEFEDVAIGDFLIAMGVKDENDVLSASRVLISVEPDEIARKSFVGEVKTIEGKQITLDTSGSEKEVFFPKTWQGPDLDELEEGNLVVVVGTEDEGFTARFIGII